MEGEKFRAREIVSACNIAWDGYREIAIILNEFLGAPLLRAIVITVVPDFEPAFGELVILGSSGSKRHNVIHFRACSLQ